MDIFKLTPADVTLELAESIEIVTWEQYRHCTSLTIREDYDTIEHYVLGVGTEVGEFLDPFKKNKVCNKPIDVVNLMEEIGDLAWYAANLFRILGEDWQVIARNRMISDPFPAALDVWAHSGHLVHLYRTLEFTSEDTLPAKRWQLAQIMARLLGSAEEVLRFYNYTWEKTWTRNIRKLFVRYLGGFNTSAALERDLDRERKMLEGKTSS